MLMNIGQQPKLAQAANHHHGSEKYRQLVQTIYHLIKSYSQVSECYNPKVTYAWR